MKKYDVHIYATVRVKNKDIKASSQVEAIKKAVENTNLNRLFDSPENVNPETEWAEEITNFLVDEVGDKEYDKSTWYNANLEKDNP